MKKNIYFIIFYHIYIKEIYTINFSSKKFTNKNG